ncbi:MAG: PadR family transcriptional regulator [Candidatus Helarchaeota archaeon]
MSRHPEGISGYQLKREINNLLKSQFGNTFYGEQDILSQSSVYRIFKALKKNNLIEGTSVIVKNRNKILYTLNSKGQKQLDKLKKIIQRIAPIEIDPTEYTKDFFAGKISPLDFISKNMPKDQVLMHLKRIRSFLLKRLQEINTKIEELEKGIS